MIILSEKYVDKILLIGLLNLKLEMHFSFILVKVTYTWICDKLCADYYMVCLISTTKFVDMWLLQ